jgi:hypothetical protein
MTKASSEVPPSVAPKARDPMKAGSSLTPPRTMDERIERIGSLGRRIARLPRRRNGPWRRSTSKCSSWNGNWGGFTRTFALSSATPAMITSE